MPFRAAVRAAFAVALLFFSASPSAAQIYEVIGTRAQGMGGAFVAVADDASATWWNPAGLAAGAYFSGIIEQGSVTEPEDHRPQGPAWESETRSFALVYPALGLSYYRLRINEIAPASSTEAAAPDRQDQGAVGVSLRSLALSQYGVTVGQSIGTHLVIASTLRLLRGGAALSAGTTADDPLDAASELDVSTESEGDLDLGAMATFGRTKLGVAVKHVREPAFGEGTTRFVLKRQGRAGLAIVDIPAGPFTVTAAADADLAKTATAFGDAQHVAAGGEVWMFGRRVGVRGGVSVNAVGERVSSTSAGASLAPRAGLFLDGAVTMGSDKSRKGWMLGLRASF
jgi:hypothetical protein